MNEQRDLCQVCGRNAALDITAQPLADDLAVCLSCGTTLVFTDNSGSVRGMTASELDELDYRDKVRLSALKMLTARVPLNMRPPTAKREQ